jgi:Zn-dependent protease
MRDFFSWAFPIGRLFGIPVRVHVLFPLIAAGLILRTAFQKDPPLPAGTWIDASMLEGLLFIVVLLHEFGHCFGARLVDGDAKEVLMWPLGGLAFVDVPHTPRANFIAVAAGPAVNLVICLISGFFFVWLTGFEVRPPWNPLPGTYGWYPYRLDESGAILLYKWDGNPLGPGDALLPLTTHLGVITLARLFWISWVLFWLNVVVIGFPLDGGRMFQCALWPRWGYRQATLAAVYAGFIFALLFGVIAIMSNELLLLGLGLFIYVTCRQQWFFLEAGGEDALLGYDFSQGYTSLERDPPPPRRRRRNFWQRWLDERARRKRQRQEEKQEAEERRMDELLEKVQREGLQALSDEERRFMKRVSDKYRNRQ